MDGQKIEPKIRFPLNCETVETEVFTGEHLSETLREKLGTRGVEFECNAADCSACTVLIDGKSACACLVTTHQTQGCVVETVSGQAKNDATAQALAQKLQDHGAAQCGIWTPGMMTSVVALLRRNAAPGDAAVQDAFGPYGAKGLGEYVLVPAAPALLNAIAHARNVRMRSVPVTPSKPRNAIKDMKNGI